MKNANSKLTVSNPNRFVSRAGLKLQAALDAFEIDVRGMTCADFGCNVGGFTDCLLQNGAAKVYAIDTGYGELAWKLRKDSRVVVMERTNALYCDVPERVNLVTIDVAWTPQVLSVPAARRWLKSGQTPAPQNSQGTADTPPGRIISLLKPHYEYKKLHGKAPPAVLSPVQSAEVCLDVSRQLAEIGCSVKAVMQSVLLGKGGNREFVFLLEV